MRPRQHLYLDDELTAEREHLASKPCASKSAILTAPLRQYVRGGAEARDEAMRQRFDRLSRQVAKLTADMDVVLNTQSQPVWLNLRLSANVPGPEGTGRSIALQRHGKFIQSVAVLRAKGRPDDEALAAASVASVDRAGNANAAHAALSNGGHAHA